MKNILRKVISFIKRKYLILILIVVVIAIGSGVFAYVKSKSSAKSTGYTEYTVRKGNIEVTISGTGSVTSSTKQTISSNVAGTIKAVYFSEGDTVKQGDLLLQLDDSTAASQVTRTSLSIEQSKRDLETAYENVSNLSVKSTINGQVSSITLSEGDSVNKGQEICTVTDTSHLKVIVPFNGSQIKNFYVGQEATVYLQDYMDSTKGTISYISSAGKVVSGGGSTYDVELCFNNPGALKSGTKASAEIDGVMSIDSGNISYSQSTKIRSQVSGTVGKIKIRDSQNVAKGEELVLLENEDLNSQILSCQIKLQDYYAQLESQAKQRDEYKIFANFDGTIVQQELKVGDVIKANDELAIISNPDAMEFEITVDELDIAKMKIGLEANVTLDALTGKTFKGVVSKVAQVGTTSSGVTTYPVTVLITNPENIKEGMNANASIIVEHADNALTLPIAAVQKMQGRSFVYAVGTSNQSTQTAQNTQQQGNSKSTGAGANGSRNSQALANLQKLVGKTLTMKTVTTGINNDNFIEIVSGLNEGDKVYVVTKTSTTTSSSSQSGFGMPGMGGMGSNGPPSDMGGSSSRTRNSSGSSTSSSSRGGDTSGE